MATNFVQDGAVMDYVNGTGAAIDAGAVVAIGNIIGIALVDIANGDTGSVAIEGCFTVPKVTGAEFVQGEKLLWDVSAGKFDDGAASPATGAISLCCVAMKAGANGETICVVKLNVGVGTVA